MAAQRTYDQFDEKDFPRKEGTGIVNQKIALNATIQYYVVDSQQRVKHAVWTPLLLAAVLVLVEVIGTMSALGASGVGDQRRLVWSEEFEGPAINRETWTSELGNGQAAGIPGWGNEELQYYTDEPANAVIEDGKLVITAREDVRSDHTGTYAYTSARMHTKGNVTVEYGWIEVRAKLPQGQGIWPAVWMLGADFDRVGWPHSGEIDIIELVGHRPGTVHGTVHGPRSAGLGLGGEYTLPGGARFSDAFHVFALSWTEEGLTWYVDGEPYFSLNKGAVVAGFNEAEWVFDHEFFFIVNLAVGGRWPGSPDETTRFPQQLEVDYIRVYELDEVS